MEREINKLEDEKLYEAIVSLRYFCIKGSVYTGKRIKEQIPCDVSPNQGVFTFFKERL